jgi:hypothetical protein
VTALNGLQTNAAVLEQIRQSGVRRPKEMTQMYHFLHRINLKVREHGEAMYFLAQYSGSMIFNLLIGRRFGSSQCYSYNRNKGKGNRCMICIMAILYSEKFFTENVVKAQQY